MNRISLQYVFHNPASTKDDKSTCLTTHSKSYKGAVKKTKIGADGFPNIVEMEDVVNIDAVKQSNYWRRNNWSPGVYSREFKINGAKITMQYTFGIRPSIPYCLIFY